MPWQILSPRQEHCAFELSIKDIEVCFVKGDAFVSFCGLLLSGEANHVLPQCAAVYTAERSFSFEVVG